MVEIVYHVAVSLDGYIATPDGGVEWLPSLEEGSDYGYSEFYASVDALLMGRQTYEKALEFGSWVYPGKPCWVFSKREIKVEQPDVILTTKSPNELIAELNARQHKRVWLVGGGQLASSFRAHGLISEYILGVIPIVLGAGIPLFAASGLQEKLELAECKPFPDGAILLRYLRDKMA